MRYLRFGLFLSVLTALAALFAGPAPVAQAATFTVDSTGDAVDANPGNGTCATAGAVCTLRAAIEEANALAGADTIGFSIGTGTQTITPLSALPIITEELTIDGTTQDCTPGAPPCIELNGSGAGNVDGLNITAGSSTVRGLVINRFGGHGVELSTNGGNTIEGNYIGTDVTGTIDVLGNTDGVLIWDVPNNTIGGTTAAERNVISGNNSRGVEINGSGATGNDVQGNYIGTDVNGTAALGNGEDGVLIWDAPSNTIGGTAAGAGNVISGNDTRGIRILGSGATGNDVQGNYIGTDVNGTAALGNGTSGVHIWDAPSNTIGGTTAAERNIISGNSYNMYITGSGSTGNVVQGNYIGTDVSGTLDLGNGDGVRISGAPGNTIGGTVAGAGNVISGNNFGIVIQSSGSTGNVVQGNYIGTDVNGTADLGNSSIGVIITASGNTIGGTAAGAGNVISGNDSIGVSISGSVATGNKVEGNYIGTDKNGTAALGNASGGVGISSASNNTIGGTAAGAGNVISGNSVGGVFIAGVNATGNKVQGNYIGTDVNGTADLGNTLDGVQVGDDAPNNTIGGTAAGAGNVISGNDRYGIYIAYSGATGNLVQGNYIGTDVNGTADLGNSNEGVLIYEAPSNTIGGTVAAARNVISGNDQVGVYLWGSGATGNEVQGNYIGTQADGISALANALAGVRVGASAQDNVIGLDPAGVGAGNTIAHNSGDGVRVDGASTTGNTIRGNSIHSNGGLGIDLGPDGVTPNDAGDPDTGANLLQNFPVLTSAVSLSITIIQGSLNSTPNTGFTLEFFSNTVCDPSNYGEGESFVGSTMVTTDGTGDVNFTATFGTLVPLGQFITATATDPLNNTSEFSQCRVVACPDNDTDCDGVSDDAEANCGGDALDPNIRPERVDGAFAGVSDDGDVDIDEALPPGSEGYDCDGDGYPGGSTGLSDEEDRIFSTSSPSTQRDQDACGNNGWPSELFDGLGSENKINLQDVTSFVTGTPPYKFGSVKGGPGYDERWNLFNGGGSFEVIDLQDITAIITGPLGGGGRDRPPMLGGARAFDGPDCPWAP